ncbi:tartrate dehydratase subunit alpha, partial [Salmonella enterica subsp. enterica serovar Heidelberg str. 579082-8]
PTVFWEIVPNSDQCSIYTYMAGGGCSLPGKAMVLMPGAGYEGVTRFVLDVMTSYGLNACPPLLVNQSFFSLAMGLAMVVGPWIGLNMARWNAFTAAFWLCSAVAALG